MRLSKLFKNPTREDMKDVLKTIAWPGTKWDLTPTWKYQLFPYNLNTYVSVWLFFVNMKIMSMRHYITISMDKAMLLYYIMEEIPVNVSKIICEHIHA